MPQGTLAKAVARLTDDGVRLTQADLERLGGGSVGEQDAARQLAAGQALIARTTEQVEGFEAMVREIRDETGQFGDDLAANAAALIGPPAMPIEKVVNIAGAMVDRVRVAERRLQAATDEASELRLKLREARDNARRDPLTGLPNRRAFEESVVAARAANEAALRVVYILACCLLQRAWGITPPLPASRCQTKRASGCMKRWVSNRLASAARSDENSMLGTMSVGGSACSRSPCPCSPPKSSSWCSRR